jgi:hypothetical protein
MINHAAANGDWEQETGAAPFHPRLAAKLVELYRGPEAVRGIRRSGGETGAGLRSPFYTGGQPLCPQAAEGAARP